MKQHIVSLLVTVTFGKRGRASGRRLQVVESPVPARANYPESAVIHEAAANMLVHRDLALRTTDARAHLRPGVEFINPRRSAGFSPVAQKAIRYGIPQR